MSVSQSLPELNGYTESFLFSTMFLDFTFVVIVCHVDPDAVPEEMAALVDVYNWATHHYGTEVT